LDYERAVGGCFFLWPFLVTLDKMSDGAAVAGGVPRQLSSPYSETCSECAAEAELGMAGTHHEEESIPTWLQADPPAPLVKCNIPFMMHCEFPAMSAAWSLTEKQKHNVKSLRRRLVANRIRLPSFALAHMADCFETRSLKHCMAFNSKDGRGCRRQCGYLHECILCGSIKHGMFDNRADSFCPTFRTLHTELRTLKEKYNIDETAFHAILRCTWA
jgi:hypothetical protein